MSSFKKARKSMQKPHRERSQPESRQHLGLLEKKSDYKQRARNFHNKEQYLRVLRKKALERNPDEFYNKMINKKLKDGEHWNDNKRKEETLTDAQKKLMATQDLNYVKMRLQMEKKKLDRLEEHVDLGERPKNKRTLFADTKEDAKRMKQEHDSVDSMSNLGGSEILNDEIKAEKEKMKKEIEKRRKRKRELEVIVDKMELKKHLSDSSVNRQKVQNETRSCAAIYEWQAVRKK